MSIAFRQILLFRCQKNTCQRRPAGYTSQRWIKPSAPLEANIVASELNANATGSTTPGRTALGCPEKTSQSLIVSFPRPLAIIVPLGAYAAEHSPLRGFTIGIVN